MARSENDLVVLSVDTRRVDACIFGWIFGKPLRDVRHVALKRARYRQVEHSGSCVAAVFEVVGDATEDKNEEPRVTWIHASSTKTLMMPCLRARATSRLIVKCCCFLGFADWRRLISLCLYARGLPVFQKETVVHIVAVNQLSRD